MVVLFIKFITNIKENQYPSVKHQIPQNKLQKHVK